MHKSRMIYILKSQNLVAMKYYRFTVCIYGWAVQHGLPMLPYKHVARNELILTPNQPRINNKYGAQWKQLGISLHQSQILKFVNLVPHNFALRLNLGNYRFSDTSIIILVAPNNGYFRYFNRSAHHKYYIYMYLLVW